MKIDINKITIPYNYVLIRLFPNYKLLKNHQLEYTAKNGIKLIIDTSYNIVDYLPRKGELIKNPERLIYEKGNPNSLAWKTEIETKENDIVYFDYVSVLNSLAKLGNPFSKVEYGKYFTIENRLYLFINYETLLFAKRSDKWIGLNGNVLLKPIYKENKSSLILPDNIKQQEDLLTAQVLVIGNANKEYIDGSVDADDIYIGDIVLTKKYRIRLDKTMMSELPEKDVFYYQRKNILAKM